MAAKAELKRCWTENVRQCDWIEFKMDVPNTSHMGGVWERQIRTVRNVLSVLLDQHGDQLENISSRSKSYS